MKVRIDAALCQSHGDCVAVAPAVFDMDDDGTVVILVPEPGEDLHARVRDAAQSCPTRAITLEEDSP